MNAATMNPLDLHLLNNYQHDFPLCSSPFLAIAEDLGVSEIAVIDAYRRLLAEGEIVRIGAVFAPRRIGTSTLAAMRVAERRLSEVAAIVGRLPGISHNCEREHEFNLWFVATASSNDGLGETLAAIERASGVPVIRLPMEEAFHADLDATLDRLHHRPPRSNSPASSPPPTPPTRDQASSGAFQLDAGGRDLVSRLQGGLPVIAHPFGLIARLHYLPEMAILQRIRAWLASGIVKRFGVVVPHHEAGYRTNAMLVHDLPDELIGEVGRRLGAEPAVSLCYRRPRVLPDWPYNLFCMIHGQQRTVVEQQIADLRQKHGLEAYPSAVLFSRTRFKPQGARYSDFSPEQKGAATRRVTPLPA